MIFKNDKIYDVLKYISLVFLDAFGLLYSGLSEVWGLPFGDEVMKTCTLLSVFIGALIGISSHNYNKGDE